MKGHDHIQQPMKVGEFEIHASASRSVGWDDRVDYVPKDLAVYLDVASWSNIRGVSPASYVAGGPRVPVLDDERGDIIYVSWPDFGEIGQDRLRRVVGKMTRALKEGRSVETGCMGGHGRTGTLLAATLIHVEGLSARDAIKQVRKRYCQRTVESPSQVRMLFEFAGEEYTQADVKLAGKRGGGYTASRREYESRDLHPSRPVGRTVSRREHERQKEYYPQPLRGTNGYRDPVELAQELREYRQARQSRARHPSDAVTAQGTQFHRRAQWQIVGSGIKVVAVKDGSELDGLLRVGDIVRSFNGQRLVTSLNLLRMTDAMSGTTITRLVLQRGTKFIELLVKEWMIVRESEVGVADDQSVMAGWRV